MKNREAMMEQFRADAFVSIHMNTFPDAKYSGPQVFFSTNDKDSERLAKLLQENLNDALKPDSPRTEKRADNSIYLLKHANLPAVLVECGFLSNEKEEQKLTDENYQKQVAWAIYCGIIDYFHEK